MKARGFLWSNEISNYVMDTASETSQTWEKDINTSTTGLINSQETNLAEYIPLLEALSRNKEKLLALLSTTATTIPRYMIPGITRTKSFYISDELSRLVCEFSQVMNISQKEIIEAAIIEFLRKYSFKNEVDEVLQRNKSSIKTAK